MGNTTTASGDVPTAMGYHTVANGHSSTAIGRYNVGSGSATSWVASDPLFEIGIGSSSSARANAMTVLKNGNVGIGATPPDYRLHVRDGIAAVTVPGTVVKDFYLKEDGTGKIWAVSHRPAAGGPRGLS
jgi:hypothetical protein